MLFKAKELAAEHKIEGFEVTLEWLEGFCRQQNWKIFFTDDENVARAPNQAGGCSEVKPTGVKEHNKSNDETSRDWPNWCRFCGSLGKTVQISEEFVALVNKFVNVSLNISEIQFRFTIDSFEYSLDSSRTSHVVQQLLYLREQSQNSRGQSKQDFTDVFNTERNGWISSENLDIKQYPKQIRIEAD